MRRGPGCAASTDAAKELLKIERLPLIPGEAGVAYEFPWPVRVIGYAVMIGSCAALLVGSITVFDALRDYCSEHCPRFER